MAGLNLLLSGKPGVGKTTLVERLVAELRARLRLAGFTTAEMRDPGGQPRHRRRQGFFVRTVGGEQAELARVGFPSPTRVGRYGVNLEAFERLALPELARRDADLIVIDEIGKMECKSGRFRRAVEDALDAPVNVLATLGIGYLPFFEALRDRPDVELITVNERNREALIAELANRLQKS